MTHVYNESELRSAITDKDAVAKYGAKPLADIAWELNVTDVEPCFWEELAKAALDETIQ